MDDGESRRFTERIFGTTLCHLFTTPDRVLLLDEAQTSYYELGFWNDFLKQLGETGVHVILFGCYGSPRRSPFSMAAETAGTPLILKEPQRIGRSWGGNPPAGLLFREEETSDLCRGPPWTQARRWP